MWQALETLGVHKNFSRKLQEEILWHKETADRMEMLMYVNNKAT